MADDQQLPIDIHSSKLLDWLISRRHCNKDWQTKVLVIREKIKHAILDMPEDERIVQLLQGTYINYFHCVQIVEILKETEKDTKNFLGFYSSQRMNDWLEIKNLYEKENIYLAEAAQILQRLVQYDIPALKRQIVKCDSVVADCSRKEDEYSKQAISSKKQYERELSNMGIKGDHLRKEIQQLAAELPSFFDNVVKRIVELLEPLEYYQNFRKYVNQNTSTDVKLLPICSLIMKSGPDTTVFEWKYGRKPKIIERPANIRLDDEVVDEGCSKDMDEIDFGDDDQIDFGGGDNIDFGIVSLETDATIDASYNIKNEDDTARGEEALSLLENAETRRLIVDELSELLGFLVFRRDEENADSSANIYISGIEKRPAEISTVTSTEIDKWITSLNDIYSKLNDAQKLHLFKIYNSPEYVSTLVEALEQKRFLEKRYEQMRSLVIEKRSDTMTAAGKAQMELNQLTNATKALQRQKPQLLQIQEEISKRYKGTPVNIMGGIVAALKTV